MVVVVVWSWLVHTYVVFNDGCQFQKKKDGCPILRNDDGCRDSDFTVAKLIFVFVDALLVNMLWWNKLSVGEFV